MQHQAVPLLANKKLRYNRRDIQIDEQFEAVRPSDADILVKAKLARPAPLPEASLAERGGNRSRIVTRDAGSSSTDPERAIKSAAAEHLRDKLDQEIMGELGDTKRANDLEPPPPPEKKPPAAKKKGQAKRKAPTSTPMGDPPANS